MKVSPVIVFGHVPTGAEVWLTKAQATSRAHLITETKSNKTVTDRKLYTANAQLGFKAGEELAIEGDLDRGLEIMFGIEADAGGTPAAKKGGSTVKKLQAAEAKVAGIRVQVTQLETEHEAEADDAKKAEIADKLVKAKQALEEAEAELTV